MNLKTADIVQKWLPKDISHNKKDADKQKYDELANELEFDEKFDLIICNPPWLPESFVSGSAASKFDLDLGVFDPNEQFLKSMMNFAKFHLDEQKGELLVIYSDFASNLGK